MLWTVTTCLSDFHVGPPPQCRKEIVGHCAPVPMTHCWVPSQWEYSHSEGAHQSCQVERVGPSNPTLVDMWEDWGEVPHLMVDLRRMVDLRLASGNLLQFQDWNEQCRP